MPNRWMKIVSGPIARIIARSDSSNPRIIAVMPTIDVMPITTPSTVSADRILFDRTVSNAVATTSLTRDALITMSWNGGSAALQGCRGRPRGRPEGLRDERPHDATSFPPQRLDRIQARGAHRRIQPEEEPHERGDADTERDRPRLDRRRHRRHRRDADRDRRSRHRADDAAEYRQHHRLGEHLRHDVRAPRARSEERRVGKECRSERSRYCDKDKSKG